MERKPYVKPESRLLQIATEQGVCYSSNDDTQIKKESSLTVEDYKEINNDITFD